MRCDVSMLFRNGLGDRVFFLFLFLEVITVTFFFFICFTFLMGYTEYVGKRREERKQEGKKEGRIR